MGERASGVSWRVEQADCVEAMREMDECSVDAIVTDPPYGLEFMGRSWDKLTPEGGRADLKDRANFKPTKSEFKDGVGTKVGAPQKNPRCRKCGKLKFDHPKGKCRCAAPDWNTRQSEYAYLQQVWHEAWATEALRVLKPGGHLLAAGGTRTFHRLVSAIEDAGFEIRDCIAHMYGSGFPKSHNGEWGGTALKPAFEPWTLARKPLIGTVEQNWQAHGTGALNVDGCRIEGKPRMTHADGNYDTAHNAIYGERNGGKLGEPAGRWPANVTLSHLPECEAVGCAPGCPVAELDRQSGELQPDRHKAGQEYGLGGHFGVGDSEPKGRGAWLDPDARANTGGASRFFYTAKASRAERNAGLDGFEEQRKGSNFGNDGPRPHTADDYQYEASSRNTHPTVKPIDLMRWLVRLVTPPDGTVLDPFAGSGTTGCAAMLEGIDFIGIERDESYVEIARARIEWWAQHQGREADEVLAMTRKSEAMRDENQEALF